MIQSRYGPKHGLSQQGVWVPFWAPKPLKRTPQDTQIFQCGISKNLNLKLMIEFFDLLIIPMTLFNDIMPYFDEFIHVYDWNMSILRSPLKIWTPKNFTTANFRHPVSNSWLRHWPQMSINQIWIPVPGSFSFTMYCNTLEFSPFSKIILYFKRNDIIIVVFGVYILPGTRCYSVALAEAAGFLLCWNEIY